MSQNQSLFATTIEALDAQTSNIHQQFGVSPGGLGAGKFGRAKWDGMVLEAEQFVDDVVKGRKNIYLFREAMSTNLFPLLFGDSIDRQLYGAYMAAPATWRNYARRGVVNDFRPVDRFATTGVRGILKTVAELAEHERRTQDEKKYTYTVTKLEAGFGLSFEAMINDDLGAFTRLPQDLAQSARDTEEWFATTLWAGASGLNTTYFTVGNNNILTGNPPLTRQNLQKALTLLMSRKDERDNPIAVTAAELVVGPGLALQAQEILDATEYRIVDGSGNTTIISGNGVSANLRLNVNFWLPTIASTANAATTWALFANPDRAGRPAIEVGFLRGYEEPALYEKVPDMRRVGGGAEVPWSYNFGDAEKKVQHILGGTFVDERLVVGSNGSNS